MKKSALTLNSAIPGSTLYTAPGLKHGEFSLGHPREYVRTINTFINHRSIWSDYLLVESEARSQNVSRETFLNNLTSTRFNLPALSRKDLWITTYPKDW